MRKLTANADASGRLDVWVSSQTGIPRGEVQRLIALGLVTSGGQALAKSTPVRPGMTIEVEEAPLQAWSAPTAGFAVRYEDEAMAFISKPAGVVVHPGSGVKDGTLVQALAAVMPLAPAAGDERPGIVHRLDKDTSGLLVVAKTDAAYARLSAALKERKLTRRYCALVDGAFEMESGRIEAPIGRGSSRVKMAVKDDGRPSVTRFEVRERLAQLSLLGVSLDTGRTHQIRVHLSHIGRPVVGDEVYGRRTMTTAGRLGLERMFLHAEFLGLSHPLTGEWIAFEEDLPEDLATALTKARRVGGAT